MKKIVLNISDTTYEKLRFESIRDKKSIPEVIQERIFYKPFDQNVEEAFENLMQSEIYKIMEY